MLLWSVGCQEGSEAPTSASVETSSSHQKTSEEKLESPSVEALFLEAQKAWDEQGWEDVASKTQRVLERDAEHKGAAELMKRAEKEQKHLARYQQASVLFKSGRFDKAELKVSGITEESFYFSLRQDLEVRIKHSNVYPEVIKRDIDGMKMRRVLVGPSTQGSPKDELNFAFSLCKLTFKGECKGINIENEQPARRVYLNTFFIDETEVSVRTYNACVESGSCQPAEWDSCVGDLKLRKSFQRLMHPQVCVSWEQSKAYCEWAGARLPSEAEWEKAARGPRNTRLPWSNKWRAKSSNWGDEGKIDNHKLLAPVQSFKPWGYGLYQMAGNVYEWTNDWYDADVYKASLPTGSRYFYDPKGPKKGTKKVIRGGSFESPGSGLRGSARGGKKPTTRNRSVGFRCAHGLQ